VRAICYMRASTWRQREGGNLDRRMQHLRQALRQKNIPIVAEYTECFSGRKLDRRLKLKKAIRHARHLIRQGKMVAIVSDCRNRFLRGTFYDRTPSTEKPLADQWRKLKKMANGVQLATLIEPDKPFNQVRTFEMCVAEQAGRHIGRPKNKIKPTPGAKKQKREQLRPLVLELWQNGISVRVIAKQLGLPKSTVGDWLHA